VSTSRNRNNNPAVACCLMKEVGKMSLIDLAGSVNEVKVQ
jgi:hypothetical protein